MKNTQQFDYSKYEEHPSWSSESLADPKYWGMHEINGKLVIDVERYKKTCDDIGITDFIPQCFKDQDIKFFTPAKRGRYDYKVNLFRDLIGEFRKDWFQEYKPIFKLIKTPSQVREDTRLNGLMMISSSEDIDMVDEDAMFAMIRRYPKYEKVIQSFYCSFISKLSTEIDRYTLIVMCELGYKGKDYSFESFLKFSDGLQKDKNGKKIDKLKKYKAYNLLHKVNNFLKHNSIESYKKLKRFYPDNVRSIEKGTANIEYENGMFAGDWIILKENYIDTLLDKLVEFFEDYCVNYLDENIEDSSWNHDDYFWNALKEMRDPYEYFGI